MTQSTDASPAWDGFEVEYSVTCIGFGTSHQVTLGSYPAMIVEIPSTSGDRLVINVTAVGLFEAEEIGFTLMEIAQGLIDSLPSEQTEADNVAQDDRS